MNYSVEEFRRKFACGNMNLKMNSKFKDNPAFITVILEMDNLISQMNISEEVMVTESNGNIAFNYKSNGGSNYSFKISCPNEDTINCIQTQEKSINSSEDGQTIRTREVIEKEAKVFEDGSISLQTNCSITDNQHDLSGRCNNNTYAQKAIYTPEGIMSTREIKSFGIGELAETYENANINSVLAIPRGAFGGFYNNNYEKRTLLVRDLLDTARIVVENKGKNMKYVSIVQLDKEYGLTEMNIPANFDYPKDVVIGPLSKNKVEYLITSHFNPKVEDGLRKYAVGRDSYIYDSAQDIDFVCEGINTSVIK